MTTSLVERKRPSTTLWHAEIRQSPISQRNGQRRKKNLCRIKNELEITEKALALYGGEVTHGIISTPAAAVHEGDDHGK